MSFTGNYDRFEIKYGTFKKKITITNFKRDVHMPCTYPDVRMLNGKNHNAIINYKSFISLLVGLEANA